MMDKEQKANSEIIRVFVIEPNAGSRSGLVRLLEMEENVEVVGVAEAGRDGVRKAIEHHPHVVLTAFTMPGINGAQVSARIREHLPATQIIIVSMQDDAHYMREAFQHGAFDYVGKPVTANELTHAIRRAYKEYQRVEEMLAQSNMTLREQFDQLQIDFDSDVIPDAHLIDIQEILDAVPLDIKQNPLIFVSYSRSDWDQFVEPLVTYLKQQGFNVWIDQDLLRGGDYWLDKINEALRNSQYLVLCLSPDALESRFVKMEYRHFFMRDKAIIPVMCRSVDFLPAELEMIQYQPYDLRRVVNTLNSILEESR